MREQQELICGTVVEFFNEKNICTGVVLGTKGQRLFVLSEQNREMNISQNRIMETIGPVLDAKEDRDKLVTRLKEISEKRRELAHQINIEELWELLEEEGGSYSLKALASFIFTEPDHHQLAALERALIADRFHFQNKDSLYIPRSKENVEHLKFQAEQEVRRELMLQSGSLWLKEVWKSESEPSSHRDFSEEQQDIIEKLKDFAVTGNESEHLNTIKELFKRADLNVDPQVAFRLLVSLGVWKADENLLIHKFGIPRYFPPEVISYAEDLVKKKGSSEPNVTVDPLDEHREDLRHLWTVSIDSEETKDIDDAISLEELDSGLFRIGIHITDVAAYIEQGDPLDAEARTRMTSIYLPDEKIPMLPPIISENLCSLIAHENKRAITFFITVDHHGSVLETRITPSFIQVKERLTYEEVNERLNLGDERLNFLHKVTSVLREERKGHGAIILHVPEVYAMVDDQGLIHLKKYSQEEPSQTIVSECMIAANAMAAKFFAEHDIPALYRTQGEAKQEDESYGDNVHPLFVLLRQRRLFARAELSTTPERHCNLGVEYYSSITSPIRRYMDLVLQRQFRSYFLGQHPAYTMDELETIITEMNDIIPKAFQITRRWNRYWLLRYIEQESIRETSALILDYNDRSVHVVLPDFMLETFIPKKAFRSLALGQIVPVKIDKVRPREETVAVIPQ
ncbi:MAG: ribonuclease R family protein [Thermodesulforhabdaceae bacterium]